MADPVTPAAPLRRLRPLRLTDATWRCIDCDMPFRGVSEEAVSLAFDAHVAYVNTQADRASDPHFALQRLDQLL